MESLEKSYIASNILDNAVLGETRGRPLAFDLIKHTKALYETYHKGMSGEVDDVWVAIAVGHRQTQMKQTAKRYNDKKLTISIPDVGAVKVNFIVLPTEITNPNDELFGQKEYILYASLFKPENWDEIKTGLGV